MHRGFLGQWNTLYGVMRMNICHYGLPWWLSCKEFPCQCRRHRFNPWVRKIPWRKNGNPLQYSSLGYAMDRGAWQLMVHGAAKSQIWHNNRSWWRGLTECGPLEKRMANHFNILALRTWMSLKMSSPLKYRRAFGSTKIMMGNRILESQITFLPAINVNKVDYPCPLRMF